MHIFLVKVEDGEMSVGLQNMMPTMDAPPPTPTIVPDEKGDVEVDDFDDEDLNEDPAFADDDDDDEFYDDEEEEE